MKKNVLVFPCGSEIGLEIHRSLSLSTHVNLFGGSSVDDHGMFVYQNYISELPNIDDGNFISELNKIIKQYDIHYIFPAHDSVVLKMSSEQDNIKCKVVTSTYETCRIARSKKNTYETLNNIIPTPKVYNRDELTGDIFPLFMKPDVGQGSKGTYKVNCIEEVDFYLKKDPSLIILEYLPGNEYTVDCFTGIDGRLLFARGRERHRITNGISVNTTWVDEDRFIEYARKINDTLKFEGAWFFQVKESVDTEFVLMEIAPRIAGTMALARGQGVNLPLLSLFTAMNIDIDVLENRYKSTIDRALGNKFKITIQYDHVYIDFDDLIIIDGKVNTQVISFIYQSLNNDKKIHLLTRHSKDVDLSLREYRLEGVFDSVIHIKDGTNKSSYIKEDKSIFIDDSFAERKEVSRSKGIPVFDGHMIESLME